MNRILRIPGCCATYLTPTSFRSLRAPPANQDHPNATFLGSGDTDAQLIRRWIANGARL